MPGFGRSHGITISQLGDTTTGFAASWSRILKRLWHFLFLRWQPLFRCSFRLDRTIFLAVLLPLELIGLGIAAFCKDWLDVCIHSYWSHFPTLEHPLGRHIFLALNCVLLCRKADLARLRTLMRPLGLKSSHRPLTESQTHLCQGSFSMRHCHILWHLQRFLIRWHELVNNAILSLAVYFILLYLFVAAKIAAFQWNTPQLLLLLVINLPMTRIFDNFATGIILRIHSENSSYLTFVILGNQVWLIVSLLWHCRLLLFRGQLGSDVIRANSSIESILWFRVDMNTSERLASEGIVLVNSCIFKLLPSDPSIVLLLLAE